MSTDTLNIMATNAGPWAKKPTAAKDTYNTGGDDAKKKMSLTGFPMSVPLRSQNSID